MEDTIIPLVALVVALIVGLALGAFVILFLCLWCKTRKQLKILQRRVDYDAVLGKRDQQKPSQGLTEYTHEPLPGTYNHLEHDPPTPIKPRSKDISPNYSAVNNLAILPDEVRTREFLEPGQLAQESAQQMVEDYIKKREHYEETQLARSQSKSEGSLSTQGAPSKSAPTGPALYRPAPGYEDVDPIEQSVETTREVKPPSPKVPQPVLHSTPGYEDVDPIEPPIAHANESTPETKHTPRIGDYNNPVDYLPPGHALLDQVSGTTGSAGQKKKTFQLSTSADNYSEVFDSLITTGGVGIPKVRAISDSKSNKEKVRTMSSGSPSHHGRVYENGLMERASERPGGSLDNVNSFGERSGSTRKRDSMKEVVELDFSKKKFRVASTKRSTAAGTNAVDGDVSPVVGSPKKTGEESYAMVKLSDKQGYRAEADDIKKEGSGVPTHYGPEQMTAITVST